MSTPKKILFLCTSDYGQANVILATSYALFASGAPVELHIGSEHALEPEVNNTIRLADETLKTATPNKIQFHGINGASQFQAMTRPKTGIVDAWQLPLPSFASCSAFLNCFSYGAMPWDPEEVVDLYAQVVSIIKEVDPDLTVIDPLYLPALTAAFNLEVKWMVLAPNTIKDFAVPSQPYGAALWKYPLINSALPYPVPWSQIPMNIGLSLVLAKVMLTDTRIKTAEKLLREHAGDEKLRLMSLAELGVVYAPPPGVRMLVAFSEDLDYPLDVLPPHITPCGPIVRHSQSLAITDPDLNAWLARGPTIYVNLGTQFKITAAEALVFALALRDLLDAAEKNLQVMWKVKRRTEGSEGNQTSGSRELSWDGEWKAVRDALLPEIEADRVRIVSWVDADPCAVLQSGHIVCSVHHGGASSHHEALVAGLPQVVLPGWLDCYDFGNRAEMNGYGIRANKTAAPRWAREELGNALKEVIISKQEATFRDNAKKLALRHPADAGRNKAAKLILETLDSE